MRKIIKFIPTIMLFVGICFTSLAQVTEAEKNLRTQSKDTLMGWKTGGVININLAQTSLTNWAAGGQNSLSINSSVDLPTTRWENLHGIIPSILAMDS
jgi:hypothetical protein